MKFKPAICPICGANLSLPDDKSIVKVKCMYCGKDIIIREAINRAIGPTIENYFKLAKTARKSGNYKEAYGYYTKILELDPENYEAWFGKGESAGWQSTLADFRLPEVITGIENAVKFCPQDKKDEIKLKGANVLNKLAIAYNNLNLEHFFKYGSGEGVGEEFYRRCEVILSALELAHSYDPFSKQILDNIISLCKLQIEGVNYKDFTEYGETIRVSHVTPQYESILRAKMNEYIDKRKAMDPSYQPPAIKKKSACFIVTATMGSENHPYVILLRNFRDHWLSRRVIGRFFIERYYKCSPQLADFIRRRKILQRISYNAIVKPSVKLAKRLLERK